MSTANYGDTREVIAPADFHVHLRDGALMRLVTPHVQKGGFYLAYVMPNLVPPITTTEMAMEYQKNLRESSGSSKVEFLMTLYLSDALDPNDVKNWKAAGIVGVKSYPRGVTTNSDQGIESYDKYDQLFREMEVHGIVLNLHGEIPSDHSKNTCVLNAEERFLPVLANLANTYPKLRIVLEHATTEAAVKAVIACGDNVACTITAHHLALTIDDLAGQSFHFCKPVAKFPNDRLALQEVVKSGNKKFFLGSDSAPHPILSKSTATPTSGCAAGIYTSPILLPLVAHLLDSFGAIDRLADFTSNFGRAFYQIPAGGYSPKVVLQKVQGVSVQAEYSSEGKTVVPFWASRQIDWQIVNVEE
ncbi:dihydroorotase [Suillus paluster]|uniref:dihydroorotase n=1 Tax=Suillus paluster TaxID=48578 RepID=UPI001B86C32C|nr:dihydroorotase [Suillus paluster]KAG1753829.1 dihydroorotase [Suillus paluster]